MSESEAEYAAANSYSDPEADHGGFLARRAQPSDLRDQIVAALERGVVYVGAEEIDLTTQCASDIADAILALPAIAAGQAALALLTGDRRDEAIEAMARALWGTGGWPWHGADDGTRTYYREERAAPALDALAALLPTGAPE